MRRLTLLPLLALTLAACGSTDVERGGKKGKGDDTSSGTTSPSTTLPSSAVVPTDTPPVGGDCDVAYGAVEPADGLDGAYLSDDFERIYVEVDDDVEVGLWSVDLDGWMAVRERSVDEGVALEPVFGLTAGHAYELRVWTSSTCSAVATRFTAGDYATATPDELAAAGTFHLPWALDELLELSVGVSATDGSAAVVPLDFEGSMRQDTCLPTTQGDLTLDGAALRLSVPGIAPVAAYGEYIAVYLIDLELTALLSADLTSLERVTASAELDVTEIDAYDGTLCAFAPTFGNSCHPCSDDPRYTCMDYDIDAGTALRTDGPMVTIDEWFTCEG